MPALLNASTGALFPTLRLEQGAGMAKPYTSSVPVIPKIH